MYSVFHFHTLLARLISPEDLLGAEDKICIGCSFRMLVTYSTFSVVIYHSWPVHGGNQLCYKYRKQSEQFKESEATRNL